MNGHRIYCLEVIENQGWDTYLGFVVIADTPTEARQLADGVGYSEGWLFPTSTTCKHIGNSKNKKGVVLGSFQAG